MMQIIIRYGLLAAAVLVLLELSRFSLLTTDPSSEILIIILALLFVVVGFLIARYTNFRSFTTFSRRGSEVCIDEVAARRLGITGREPEVLLQMNNGKSNRQIAEALYISVPTVKTHISNLFSKLDANRRTEALFKARKEGIISTTLV